MRRYPSLERLRSGETFVRKSVPPERDLQEARVRNRARLTKLVNPQETERRRVRQERSQFIRRCEICEKKIEGRDLKLDHCHVSGTIRGCLCNLCNSGLGMFRDNVALLRHAIAYLERHGSWSTS